MKKFLILTVLVATVVFATTSCTKYDEGGYQSKSHLKGTWKPIEYAIGSTTTTIDENSGEKMTFNRDGSGSFSTSSIGGTSITMSFTWEFVKDNKSIKLTTNGTSSEVNVAKLTRKELWTTSTTAGITIITKYEKQ